jgi:hypothetical protein
MFGGHASPQEPLDRFFRAADHARWAIAMEVIVWLRRRVGYVSDETRHSFSDSIGDG